MTPGLFPPSLFAQLDKLSQLFVWRRKFLRSSIVETLQVAGDQYDMTRLAHQNTLVRLESLAQSYALLTDQQARTNEKLGSTQQAHARLAEEFQSLQQHHGDTWIRFQLVSGLLAAQPQESDGLACFRELLVTDYMAFAEAESSLAAEAKALTLLQSIEQELALLVGFPVVRERTIVGIVGGFSSGKSEFINSFINDPQVRLAVGLKPVTIIPSYVLATDERMIRGYSARGGYIDLAVDFYNSISHAFISSFSFDLKSLMPFMCVGVQMRHECFSDICFIDTPGYNPPSTAAAHSQGDRRTAVQFAQQADSIVWLIGLDSNGTVPDSDLAFIQQIGVDGRSVYVVLTKADLKSKDDIDDIIEDVQGRLYDEGLQIDGICAYSSITREEVTSRKVSLLEYFARINRRGNARQRLEKRLGEVFAMYDEAIQADIANLNLQKDAINGLRLDCLEYGGQLVYERMLNPIDRLARSLDTVPLEAWLRESRRLHDSFIAAIKQTSDALEIS